MAGVWLDSNQCSYSSSLLVHWGRWSQTSCLQAWYDTRSSKSLLMLDFQSHTLTMACSKSLGCPRKPQPLQSQCSCDRPKLLSSSFWGTFWFLRQKRTTISSYHTNWILFRTTCCMIWLMDFPSSSAARYLLDNKIHYYFLEENNSTSKCSRPMHHHIQ